MAADGPWLRAEGVRKEYGGVVALEDTSLHLRAGEIRGLVGANGAGKSTLVKVLTGIVAPTRGRIVVDGAPLRLGRPTDALRAGIASVPQELTVAPAMTVAENVMLGHEPRGRVGRLRMAELRRCAAEVLDSIDLAVPLDAPVGTLSLIEQRLVMIARALSYRARLVIFDEPTATVSPREVELLLATVRALAEHGASVLYVSHRLDEIERLCDEVTVLRDGRVVAEVPAGGSRAALVDLLASRDPGARGRARSAPGGVVLSLRGVEGERLRSVDLDVRAGEVVGLAGLAGSGAREVLLTVCGAVGRQRGSVTLDGRLLPAGDTVRAVRRGIAFLPGDRALAVFPAHTVRHNVALAALSGLFVRPARERSTVSALLDRVALRADPEALVSTLSGGNQQKALVARWLATGARVVLLDDPTAGVDVATRPEIHDQIRALRDRGAAVVLVSTDADELVELSDRILIFDRGTPTGELSGRALTAAGLLAAMTEKGAP